MENIRIKILLILYVFCPFYYSCNSLIACNSEIVDKTEILKTGDYMSCGDYLWIYKIDLKCKIGQPDLAEIYIKNDTPFLIHSYNLEKTTNNSGLRIEVLIRKDQLTDSLSLKKYNLVFSVVSGDSINITDTCKVHYPLPKHPRLLVKSNEIDDLKERFTHPDFDELRCTFNRQKSYEIDGVVFTDKPDEKVRQKMEALALSYLLTTNKQDGLQAVKVALNYLSSYSAHRKTVQKDYHYNLQTYEAIFGAAMVYDWCYDLLSF